MLRTIKLTTIGGIEVERMVGDIGREPAPAFAGSVVQQTIVNDFGAEIMTISRPIYVSKDTVF